MLTERSFSEILEDLSDNSSIEKSNFDCSAHWESSLEPAYVSELSQLIGELKVQISPSLRNAFSLYNRGPHKKATRTRKPHLLNDEQKAAFKTLAFYQEQLFSEAFSVAELKSAYRQALLKTHPDQGGTAESFQGVRKSYEILQAFVTK